MVGTLVGAIAIRTRARDLIGPLLVLPLLDPGGPRRRAGHRPLFAAGGRGGAPGPLGGVLALYDLIFALLAYAVFDFLLED